MFSYSLHDGIEYTRYLNILESLSMTFFLTFRTSVMSLSHNASITPWQTTFSAKITSG